MKLNVILPLGGERGGGEREEGRREEGKGEGRREKGEGRRGEKTRRDEGMSFLLPTALAKASNNLQVTYFTPQF